MRAQESLSLSHAVSIALCALYQPRLQFLASSLPGAHGASQALPPQLQQQRPSGVPGGGAGAEYAVNHSTGVVVNARGSAGPPS